MASISMVGYYSAWDGLEIAPVPDAPLRVLAAGKVDRYWTEVQSAEDGCLMTAGSRQGEAVYLRAHWNQAGRPGS